MRRSIISFKGFQCLKHCKIRNLKKLWWNIELNKNIMILLLIISLFLSVLGLLCFWLTFKEVINHTYVETVNKIAVWLFLVGVTILLAYFVTLLFTLKP